MTNSRKPRIIRRAQEENGTSHQDGMMNTSLQGNNSAKNSKVRKRASKPIFTGTQTTLLMGLALFAGTALSSGFARPKFSAEYFTNINLFGRVYEEVHENYVSPPEDKELVKGAIDGMLSTLDPHSSYLTPDNFKTMQEQTSGSFAGLGIQVQMPNEGPDKGYVLIVAPIDDTPAARAGLQTNDLIIEIDGEPIQGKNLDEAIALMKGERGTKIEITVLRERDKPSFKVPLVRDIVRVDPVTARAEGEFGFIRISTFSQLAEANVSKAITELNEEIPGGMKGLVLDMRANPGGLLDQAVSISDLFLDGGEIVSTRGRRPKDTLREIGTSGDRLNGKPIIVLINGGSASASEIVAGALQDRNRALLLGTKSFGKGSVQTIIPLQNGLQGALRLTTARYYTPSGRSIQAQGIEPDIDFPVIYPGQDASAPRRSEADLPGALDVKPEDIESTEATNDTEGTINTPESGADTATEETTSTDVPAIEPFLCEPVEEDVIRDCQLEKALEILADNNGFKQALAQAATVER